MKFLLIVAFVATLSACFADPAPEEPVEQVEPEPANNNVGSQKLSSEVIQELHEKLYRVVENYVRYKLKTAIKHPIQNQEYIAGLIDILIQYGKNKSVFDGHLQNLVDFDKKRNTRRSGRGQYAQHIAGVREYAQHIGVRDQAKN